MRRWLVLAGIAAALVAGDRAALAFADAKVESAVRDRLGVETAASIQSFPFVGRLAVSGSVPRLVLRLREVEDQGVDIDDIRFDARDVTLDRSVLRAGRVRVTDVGEVRIRATIRPPVAIPGGASVTIGGGSIRVGPVRLPAPGTSLLPCEATATVEGGAIVLACTVEELPSYVANAVL